MRKLTKKPTDCHFTITFFTNYPVLAVLESNDGWFFSKFHLFCSTFFSCITHFTANLSSRENYTIEVRKIFENKIEFEKKC